MNRLTLILAILCAAGVAVASDSVWQVTTDPTNGANTVTADCKGFAGELDEIAFYVPTDGTGTVTFAAIDPYSGSSVTLGSASGATAYTVFRPRVAAVSEGGAGGITMTNATASTERLIVAGEAIRATLTDANESNTVWTFRLKYVK